jgi:hypothetical protein
VEAVEIRDDLLNAIHGAGAFRNFKYALRVHRIESDWFVLQSQRRRLSSRVGPSPFGSKQTAACKTQARAKAVVRSDDQYDRDSCQLHLSVKERKSYTNVFAKSAGQVLSARLAGKGRTLGSLHNPNGGLVDWLPAEKSARAFSTENNCVGIALQGLAEGGASAIAKPPTVRFYGEPAQLETYARELEQRFAQVEGLPRILDVSIRSHHLALEPISPDQLGDGISRLDPQKRRALEASCISAAEPSRRSTTS